MTTNNDTPHQNSPKNQNRRGRLRKASYKIPGGGGWGGGGGGGGGGASTILYSLRSDQPSPLVLPWFLRHSVVWFGVEVS